MSRRDPHARGWPAAALLLAMTLALVTACGNGSPEQPSPAPTPGSASSSASGESTPPPTPASPEVIAGHIDALENASGSSYDPLTRGDAAALVAIGESALPALIDCFESDTRLTQISDDNWHRPGLLDVSTLCLRIAEATLDEPGLAYREGAQDRHAAASALRAYLSRYGSMAPAARRVAMLTDDTTSDQTAAIAARWLTSTTGPSDVVSSIDYIGTRRRVGPPRGRSLRDDPQIELVSAMLPRATRALAAGHGNAGCEMAASVVEWDASAEPRLLPFARACVGSVCPCSYAFVALVAREDPAVAARFVEDGVTLLANDSFSRGRGVQIARALDVPEVRRAVEARLGALDVEAALHDAVRFPPPCGLVVLLLAWSRAGLVLAQTALESALADASLLGSIAPDPGADGARVHLASAEYTLHLPEPITAGQSMRANDLMANTLAMELGVLFSLGWPEARRDAVMAELRSRLGPG